MVKVGRQASISRHFRMLLSFQEQRVHGEAEPRRRGAQEEHARQALRAGHAQHGPRADEEVKLELQCHCVALSAAFPGQIPCDNDAMIPIKGLTYN